MSLSKTNQSLIPAWPRRQHRLGLALLCTAMGVLLVACADDGGGIDSFNNSALYPAKIAAIQFGDDAINAGSTLTFGNWTIGFANGQAPVAKFSTVMLAQNDVSISPLSCENAVAGTVSCSMTINYAGAQGDHCIFFGPGMGTAVNIISCPTGMIFER